MESVNEMKIEKISFGRILPFMKNGGNGIICDIIWLTQYFNLVENP